MATVVVSPCNVVNFLDGGGGHFWVYMQYVLGLKKLGCDVYWLEAVASGNPDTQASRVTQFQSLMQKYGMEQKIILYVADAPSPAFINVSQEQAAALFRRADFLLNFHYAMSASLLTMFRRTALIDIDPGLLQFWISVGQLQISQHDVYFTIGESVGQPSSPIPTCNLPWKHIRPIVYLDAWPLCYDPDSVSFTTVSNWWGQSDWVIDNRGNNYENTKRASFLQFAQLPRMTNQPLELALYLSESKQDQNDRRLMTDMGWRIIHSRDVAATPAHYQAYIQRSRGEFSCAKPSYIKFQTAWVSDRTVCYLASGKPVVVQDTGPSALLPSGEGMFRVSTVNDASKAFIAINTNYRRHCEAARDLAERMFDAEAILPEILNEM